MNNGSHETEDLIQTRRGEDGRSDMCAYHYARIKLQHSMTKPFKYLGSRVCMNLTVRSSFFFLFQLPPSISSFLTNYLPAR